MMRSQAVHHGQEVVSFAAAAGRLVSRLCKLPHDFSQFCVGLQVLLHRVIIVHYLKYSTRLVLVKKDMGCLHLLDNVSGWNQTDAC